MSKSERKDLEQADKLSEKGRWDESIAKLEMLVTSADPEIHDLALNYLADAYAATSRDSEAESMLRRSIEERGAANEGLGWQLAVLAPVVRRQGRHDEAEEIYIRALGAMREDDTELKAITKRNLAFLYWTTGREEMARKTYLEIGELDEGFQEFLSGVMRPYLEPEIPA